ncbi:carboxymuconolactone decarboxylase family protein [Parendozoicomonas haliclonae]|uniref:Carboxymuconolactone decarboxylase family protein n=1 Tax=Parendozoicomonas haliclonae TaxID=1960125 RepID=A0A1X7ALY7_9GAMM|nr:carboxymuconolactone decarboxylase family protein [Parendozoicomonas haliclonae]SMA46576.1 Carboxymuconolactone decarboxylase family protein [Parendozoicomonas haliclonae]
MLIKPADPARLPIWLRWFFIRQERTYGQMLQPALMWARKPSLFVLFASTWATLSRKKSPLAPSLRALVQVYVARLNWCEFCVDLNSLTLIQQAGGEDKLTELDNWQTSDSFTTNEKVALAWTKAMSETGCPVTPELRAELKEHFSDQQIMELTALISFQNMSARFNAALDLPAQGLCEMPKKAR